MKPLWPLFAGTMLLLGGCAIYPEYDPYYDPPVVRVAPPPPRIEYVGPPPAVGYIWIEGYWNWIGTRYVWVPGRWEAPRPGFVWVPHRWERDGDHWRFHSGRWERGESPRVFPRQQDEHRLLPPHFENRRSPAPLAWNALHADRHRWRFIDRGWHKVGDAALGAPEPRFEQRFVPQPVPDTMPTPPQRSQPPRLDQESRRPAQLDPSRLLRRRANPPDPERFERDRGRPVEWGEKRRWRDHSGNDRLEMR